MLRVEEHLNLLSVLYPIPCLEPDSACKNITRVDTPPKMKKQTLYTEQQRTIWPLLSDTKQKSLQAAYTEFVRNSLIQVGPNRVLGYRPSPINEEAILPRHQRTVLSQLRSGHCQLINDYEKRTKRAESSSCNECDAALQDVAHLFACPAHPTNLTPSSLWSRPTEAIQELSYLFPSERERETNGDG